MSRPVPFVANTAAEALAHIEATLGPDAVVMNVRNLPAKGLSRLWSKPQVEVLVRPPAAPLRAPARPEVDVVPEPPSASVPRPRRPAESSAAPPVPTVIRADPDTFTDSVPATEWKVQRLLLRSGLLPIVVQRVIEELESSMGSTPPSSLAEEVRAAREVLRQLWTVMGPPDPKRPQVLVGAPGVGKTTLICKWLTRSILGDGNSGRVWRLDGASGNHDGILGVHAEALGVPVERSLESFAKGASGEFRWVDIPGVDWRDGQAMGDLSRVLDKISGAEVHLVLNGAYEIPVLMAQIRGFSALRLRGIFVTHLDEEARWAKLWNLVLGTPLALRFLGVGGGLPGEFMEATPDLLNARLFGPS